METVENKNCHIYQNFAKRLWFLSLIKIKTFFFSTKRWRFVKSWVFHERADFANMHFQSSRNSHRILDSDILRTDLRTLMVTSWPGHSIESSKCISAKWGTNTEMFINCSTVGLHEPPIFFLPRFGPLQNKLSALRSNGTRRTSRKSSSPAARLEIEFSGERSR